MGSTTNLAVDISDIITSSLAIPGMELYCQFYPLKDMIADLMLQHPCPGADELFSENLVSLMPYYIEPDDTAIQFFMETLFINLDRVVEMNLGKSIGHCTYSMKQWLHGNTAMLEVITYDN